MQLDLVEFLPQAIEPALLRRFRRRRRDGHFGLQRQVALVPPILLRMAGVDPSSWMPSFSHHTAKRDSRPGPVDANGEPLSVRNARGTP